MEELIESQIFCIKDFFKPVDRMKFISLINNLFTNQSNRDFLTRSIEHPDIQNILKIKLEKYFPQVIIANKLALTVYVPEGEMLLHQDHKYSPNITHTFNIYLNDDYQNGEIIFNLPNGTELKYKPKAGDAIIFDIRLSHLGNQVKDRNKYLVGTQICV